MTRLSAAEAAALAWLDGRAAAMLAEVEAWAAINTGSRNLAGLSRMADVLADAFAPLGGNIRRVPPAPAETVDAAGRTVALAHGDNLHVSRARPSNKRVLLTGHMDTVFADDHPFQSLTWLDEGVLNGPGVADMKGGIAVMKAALECFEVSPFADQLAWEVVLNADEEVSSLGSAPLLADAASRCQVGLTFEPSALPDGTLAGARKGSGNFAAAITGQAAHAGRNPDDGRNAIVAAADLALRLDAMRRERPGLSVNVARIDGGGPNNVVPDAAVLRWNMRPATMADQHWAAAAIDAAIAATAVAHDVGISLSGRFARPPKPMDAHQERLFLLVKACGADLGLDIGWRDTGGVCDGNNLAAAGLAVVDTLGVRGGSIHSDREFMITASLVERARLSALILMRIAQGAWDGQPETLV
jgi:glutamate carboxypeptidase